SDTRLPERVLHLMQSSTDRVYVSMASVWEVAIKHKKHPKDMPISSTDLLQYLHTFRTGILPIKLNHITATETLPDIHKDPFDRLLIAQAISEPMRFLTHDEKLAEYSELVEWV
ncbi:MAG: type II toxin-antitoxin system VapC family toxin, partial [Neisseriaceae bacterium]|nr:type II toxin-antitoxin system VapC family toxin [Neisseriaceae bacterium]